MNEQAMVARAVATGVLTPGVETIVARAPGRLDVMGGIADYSGSLVLQMPLGDAAWVAAQWSDDAMVRIFSGERRFVIDRATLVNAEVDDARALFAGDQHWAGYVAGVVIVLARIKGVSLHGGLRLAIESTVPEGKGVSSSAAIEVATMQAVAGLCDVRLDPTELATLCQIVENRIVGAPCGIMDQMTSACGRADRLLALRCQPAEIVDHLPIPPGLGVWGIDSGVRHAVSGADYVTVRTAAFMGLRILETLADGDRWGGYLANVALSEWHQHFEARVPQTMTGEAFVASYGSIGDAVTVVDPSRRYPVRAATAHPIGEHYRVRVFARLLASLANRLSANDLSDTLQLLGEMMYQSHASYSACGLGSEATDRLVAMARRVPADAGLFGAKITGGGSGGTVAVFGRADAEPAVRELAKRYARETGRGGRILSGSSPGAVVWGVRRVRAGEVGSEAPAADQPHGGGTRP